MEHLLCTASMFCSSTSVSTMALAWIAYCLTITMGSAEGMGAFFPWHLRNCRGVSVLDLSYKFDNETVYFEDEDKFYLNTTIVYEPNGTPFQLDGLAAAAHGGTHLDAPRHFNADGWSVADIPLERLLYVPVALVDIEEQAMENSTYRLSASDLHQWERKHGRLPNRGLLLVRTGWSKFWPNRAKYLAKDSQGVHHFPAIGADASEFIANERNLYGVGIDTGSVDIDAPHLTHIILSKKMMYNLENLADLHAVPFTGAHALVMPMKISISGGAPARVVVVVPKKCSKAERHQ